MTPAPQDPLVGRSRELTALETLLDSGRRGVVLTGAGGVGKTRLALELLGRIAHRFPERAAIDLAETRAPEQLCAAVAGALGAHAAAAAEEPQARVGATLAERGRLLLVLDGFDLLVQRATALLERWLRLAPELRILVTSRVRPPTSALAVQRVDPLPEQDAVELLLRRAADRDAAAWTGREADARRIVRRLECLPLAIELTAARAALLGPAQMLERLDRGLDAVGDASAEHPPRHATLAATLDSSMALLSASERRALARCAVFRGPFTATDAEQVMEPDAEGPSALDALQRLVEHSLLQPGEATEGGLRLRLLGPIQELIWAGMTEVERREGETRHARHFARRAAELRRAAEAGGEAGAGALAELRASRENLRAAGESSLIRAERGDSAAAGRAAELLLALDRLVWSSGPIAPHERRLDRILDAGGQPEPRARAALLLARANLRQRRGRAGEALADLEAARDLATSRDEQLLGRIIRMDGLVRLLTGRFDEARDRYAEALAIQRRVGDRLGEGLTRGDQGTLARLRGALDDAEERFEEALAIHREVGNFRQEVVELMGLANVQAERGRAAEAEAGYRRLLDLASERAYPTEEALAQGNLALVLLEEGRHEEAAGLLDRSTAMLRRLGDLPIGGIFRAYRALVDQLEGDLEAALAGMEEARGLLGGPVRRQVVVLTAMYGALACRAGQAARGRRLLEEASTMAAERTDPHVDATLALLLTVARTADAGDTGWAELAAALLEARAEAPGRDFDFRLALRLAGQALADEGIDPTEAAARVLSVEETGLWFQLPGGDRRALKPTSPARRLLCALARARRAEPGRGMDTDMLVRAVWPEEQILPRAARNRLNVALSALRSAGLREPLRKDAAGYYLDPALPLAILGGEGRRGTD